MNKRAVGGIVVLVVLALLAMFVWPTRYEYTTTDMGGMREVRTDRFTGEAQICGAGKWQTIEIVGDEIILPRGTQIDIVASGEARKCSHGAW